MIGAEAAADQVRRWWIEAQIAPAGASGLMVVAEVGGRVIGVSGSAVSVELIM